MPDPSETRDQYVVRPLVKKDVSDLPRLVYGVYVVASDGSAEVIATCFSEDAARLVCEALETRDKVIAIFKGAATLWKDM